MPGRRQTLQRGVIILPSAFTLGNLFFGVYAMVSVSRGDFLWAGWCIIIAGILDMLDGSVARLTRTGSGSMPAPYRRVRHRASPIQARCLDSHRL